MDSHRKKLVAALIGIFIVILACALFDWGSLTGAVAGGGSATPGLTEVLKFDIIIELVFILAIIITIFYLEIALMRQK
ncbi:hypothetical protein KY362_06950 [Candidatus Woesearchaeota archaeon]|nr:hypothetical protein [Candidatus Woesearchaeota archaeon]